MGPSQPPSKLMINVSRYCIEGPVLSHYVCVYTIILAIPTSFNYYLLLLRYLVSYSNVQAHRRERGEERREHISQVSTRNIYRGGKGYGKLDLQIIATTQKRELQNRRNGPIYIPLGLCRSACATLNLSTKSCRESVSLVTQAK